MLEFPRPHHLPCPDCGASVPDYARAAHECEEGRRLDYVVFQLRDEVDLFGEELEAWLESPAGRFAVWEAARRRPGER